MGLLNDLETQLEQEIAAQLQESLQQALNDFRSECTDCGLLMHRHQRYPRSLMSGYGEVRLRNRRPPLPRARVPAAHSWPALVPAHGRRIR